MENYYFLTSKHTLSVASAIAPYKIKLAHELIPDLEGVNNLPFKLNLVHLLVAKNELIETKDLSGLKEIWLDYLPNSLAWPFMSSKLKNIVDAFLTDREGIDWIKAEVNGNDEHKTYYIPRFKKMLDVLDAEKTLFVSGTDNVIRPCFSLVKIKNLAVFHTPISHDLWKITSGLYINQQLKNAIQKEKITGIAFEKTRVS